LTYLYIIKIIYNIIFLKFFIKKVITLFNFSQKVNYKTEILSSITAILALVPEAIIDVNTIEDPAYKVVINK